jgi:methyl-accepting chemotaxis protein
VLERFRIGTRLGFGFGVLITAATAAFVASAVIGVRGQDALRKVGDESEQRVAIVAALREQQLVAVSSIRSAGLQTDGAALNAEVDNYRRAVKALAEQEAAFAALSLTDEERSLLQQTQAVRAQAGAIADEAIRFAMAFAGDEAAKALSGKFSPLEQQWARQLVKLAELQSQRALAAKDGIAAANRDRVLMLALLLGVVILGSAAFAVALTRSVTRPLRDAAGVAARVAQGDLAVEIRPQGQDEAAELLRSLASMAGQLSTMVGAVREAAESIDNASREISQGNVDLSTRTEQQAGSVQQTSATLQALTGMVSHNASNAEAMREVAERTAEVAGQGGTAMTSVAQTMTRISDSSQRIADIIGTIDGIAFQTNILALNAAVEAARAGEQGRGFAVVASEVRTLAQRVTAAAAEVRQLIHESVERVDDGARQVHGLSDTMNQLLAGVAQVRTLVGDITAASSDQSRGIGQVNQSVQAIETTTQQNSALVEQVAAAAQSLSGQTERLTDLVRRFRVAA